MPEARPRPRESLPAQLDFLASAFVTNGLPLALHVDYHSFFFTLQPEVFAAIGGGVHHLRQFYR